MEENNPIYALSQAFAEYVVTCYEPKAMQTLIDGRHGYLLESEKASVQDFLQQYKEQDSIRAHIAQKVQHYLESEDTQILEGIVHFRLKEYRDYLVKLVDKAVHAYEMQEEYAAFLLLLRSYVEEQIPLYDMVHFIVRKGDTVDLLAEDGSVIVYACQGDVLLDTLLTIAPRKIAMHRAEVFASKELLETIQGVFAGKISVCNGCALCGKIPI